MCAYACQRCKQVHAVYGKRIQKKHMRAAQFQAACGNQVQDQAAWLHQGLSARMVAGLHRQVSAAACAWRQGSTGKSW